jgi:hypothetical protein
VQDALVYSIMWSIGHSALDTLRLMMQGIEWFLVPGEECKEGWYLHIGGSKIKTLAKQARMSQLWEDGSLYTPMQAHGVYVAALGEIGLSLRPGFLSRELVVNEDGSYAWGGQSEYADLNLRFKAWTQMVSGDSTLLPW